MCFAGHFYLELKGLAPGRYHYKYIIDNTWAVDGLAPKVLDSQVGWSDSRSTSQPAISDIGRNGSACICIFGLATAVDLVRFILLRGVAPQGNWNNLLEVAPPLALLLLPTAEAVSLPP
jgi:hypothetical protein